MLGLGAGRHSLSALVWSINMIFEFKLIIKLSAYISVDS